MAVEDQTVVPRESLSRVKKTNIMVEIANIMVEIAHYIVCKFVIITNRMI